MHYSLYVTFDKEHASTSKEAREHVQRELLEQGFANQDSAWSNAPADWFVIGGRWSGELTKVRLDQERLKKLVAEFEEKHGFWTGGEEKVTRQQRHEQWMKLQKKHFSDIKVPLEWRDTYKDIGAPDDAAIVDAAIFESILKPYKGLWGQGGSVWKYTKRRIPNISEKPLILDGRHVAYDIHWLDLDDSKCDEEFIGNKWIVVVDYHN